MTTPRIISILFSDIAQTDSRTKNTVSVIAGLLLMIFTVGAYIFYSRAIDLTGFALVGTTAFTWVAALCGLAFKLKGDEGLSS